MSCTLSTMSLRRVGDVPACPSLWPVCLPQNEFQIGSEAGSELVSRVSSRSVDPSDPPAGC